MECIYLMWIRPLTALKEDLIHTRRLGISVVSTLNKSKSSIWKMAYICLPNARCSGVAISQDMLVILLPCDLEVIVMTWCCHCSYPRGRLQWWVFTTPGAFLNMIGTKLAAFLDVATFNPAALCQGRLWASTELNSGTFLDMVQPEQSVVKAVNEGSRTVMITAMGAKLPSPGECCPWSCGPPWHFPHSAMQLARC